MKTIPKPGDKVRRNRPEGRHRKSIEHGKVYTVKEVRIWCIEPLDVDLYLVECAGSWMLKYFEPLESKIDKEFEELWYEEKSMKFPLGTIMLGDDRKPLYVITGYNMDRKTYSVQVINSGVVMPGIYPATIQIFKLKFPKKDKEYDNLWI